MKKITLLVILFFNAAQIGFSCRCQSSNKTFCDELQSITQNQIVARIQIEKCDGARAEARILNLYKGREHRKNIRIWGSDGVNCNHGFCSVGEVFIVLIRRYEQTTSSGNQIDGDYDSGLICNNTVLWVDNGKIKGKITQLNVTEQIIDSDPNKLPFCPSFQTNDENLQNIQIFPNPTSDNLIVKGLQSDITLDVFDVVGRHLFEKTVSASNNIVSLGNFASGLYIIRLRRNTIVRGLKFVKI